MIKLIPTAGDEIALRNAKPEAFRSNLINKPLAAFQFTDLNKKKLAVG